MRPEFPRTRTKPCDVCMRWPTHPLFAFFESEFGLGSIGGHLYQDIQVGAEGARTAIRILRGEIIRTTCPH